MYADSFLPVSSSLLQLQRENETSSLMSATGQRVQAEGQAAVLDHDPPTCVKDPFPSLMRTDYATFMDGTKQNLTRNCRSAGYQSYLKIFTKI